MATLTLSDVAEMTRRRRNDLSADNIRELAADIRNADMYGLARAAEISPQRAYTVLSELRSRLDALAIAEIQPTQSQSTSRSNTRRCEHCGMECNPTWLLTTSLGEIVCADCYDKLESRY